MVRVSSSHVDAFNDLFKYRFLCGDGRLENYVPKYIITHRHTHRSDPKTTLALLTAILEIVQYYQQWYLRIDTCNYNGVGSTFLFGYIHINFD